MTRNKRITAKKDNVTFADFGKGGQDCLNEKGTFARRLEAHLGYSFNENTVRQIINGPDDETEKNPNIAQELIGELGEDNLEIFSLFRGEDKLWNAIIIISHVQMIRGKEYVSYLDDPEEIRAAISQLDPNTVIGKLIGRLVEITELSPYPLVREEARRKLVELDL